MTGKRALITGITGQDGAYLARLLLDKGYEVYGAHRRTSSLNLWRLHEFDIVDSIKLVPLELLEFSNIVRILDKLAPTEIYNLAAQSHVGVSFDQPIYTADVDGLGVSRLLEAIRLVNPQACFYQASSSEMFGKVMQTPQTEETPFYPRSPYSCAKAFAHHLTINYRESYGIRGCCGILFNHESPLRGMEFVTRKITAGLANIKLGHADALVLGNLDAKRDWGFAGDYVEGMWRMLQQVTLADYVLATGETHSVREFVELAAEAVGFTVEWSGKGVHEQGIDLKTGATIVKIHPDFYRPAEVDLLLGNAGKAQRELGWSISISFGDLVRMMAEKDMERAAGKTVCC